MIADRACSPPTRSRPSTATAMCPGYYNTVTKQIVDGPGDNVIEVSVRQIPYREFFGRIYTKDQSYVVWSNQSGGNG